VCSSDLILLTHLFAFSALAAILTAALYAPVLMGSGWQSLLNHYVVPQTWGVFTHDLLPSLASMWDGWHDGVPFGLRVLLALGVGVAVIRHKQVSRHRVSSLLAAAVWIVPFVLADRVVVYTRMWLFLLPFYLEIAAAGITYLLRGLVSIGSRGVRIPQGMASLLLTLVLSVTLGSIALNIAPGEFYQEKGRWADVSEVAVFLKGNLRSGDCVTGFPGTLRLLTIVCELYGVPTQYLSADPASSARLLVVVRTDRAELIEDVLQGMHNVNGVDGAARVIRRWPSAVLYEISRIPG
jgi:hypothetical protein